MKKLKKIEEPVCGHKTRKNGKPGIEPKSFDRSLGAGRDIREEEIHPGRDKTGTVFTSPCFSKYLGHR